jgi:hypothetical protein
LQNQACSNQHQASANEPDEPGSSICEFIDALNREDLAALDEAWTSPFS